MSTQRASMWALTINNPTPGDYEAINLARQKGWKVEGQIEKGESGTLHLQLSVRTPQVRFSAVKKQFQRAHIGIARNPAALASYVTKEETRVGQLPTGQDKYPSLAKFWDLIFQRMDEWNWIDFSEGEPGGWFKDAPKGSDLDKLDDVVGTLIEEGYYVESIATNPSTRAAWKNWAFKILTRSFRNKMNQATEHNHADDTSSPSSPERILEGEQWTEVHLPTHQGRPRGEESSTEGTQSGGDDCETGDE